MKNIGPELNRIMTERRIVRKDIAKEVGITPTYLSAIVKIQSTVSFWIKYVRR